MSTVISPATGKLIKVGSKEFQDLMNDPRYRDYFTYPKASDLNARVTPLVPYVAPSTALPIVPAYGSLNSYSSASVLPPISQSLPSSIPANQSLPSFIPANQSLPSVPSSVNRSNVEFPQETNSDSDEMTQKFGINNRSASDSNPPIVDNSARSIPNSLIIPPQYPAEKINLASVSVPIQQVWPSLSGCQNCYYRP